jgi:hypothetical protein
MYESYYKAKTKNSKTGGIVKVSGLDGKMKKMTNFGRKQCKCWSNQHCKDIWLVEEGKMKMVVANARKAADAILVRNHAPKQALSTEDEAGLSHEVGRLVCIESDLEFWYIHMTV